jgi:RNA polymerase sigma-70 factor (ECF subfamily)
MTDRAAMEEALEALHPAAHAWALACCRWDRSEAEDVLQTSYLKLLDGRAAFAGGSSLRTFLFAVIRHTAVDRRRRRWVMTLGLSALLEAGEPTESPPDDSGAAVRRALSRLSQRQREVLELVFFHGNTVEEAAAVMGVSVGSARTHYHRGKSRLAEELDEHRER